MEQTGPQLQTRVSKGLLHFVIWDISERPQLSLKPSEKQKCHELTLQENHQIFSDKVLLSHWLMNLSNLLDRESGVSPLYSIF